MERRLGGEARPICTKNEQKIEFHGLWCPLGHELLLAKSLRIFVRAGEEWGGAGTLAVALWIAPSPLIIVGAETLAARKSGGLSALWIHE